MKDQQKPDDAVLLKQLSLRQEDTDQQVLQALQQAMNALLQAQQLIQSDRKYHQQLQQARSYDTLLHYSPIAQKQDGSIPPWLLGKPPDLQ